MATNNGKGGRHSSPLLVPKEVATYLRIRLQTLSKMRVENRGPEFRKAGRFVRYHIEDVESWLKKQNASGR